MPSLDKLLTVTDTLAVASLVRHVASISKAHEARGLQNPTRSELVRAAARIMNTASAGDVVISRTVKDLVAGSGIAFGDAGEHSLKGIEEKWQLFKVRTIA